MPYFIRKTPNKREWCVYKKDTGEQVGCSESEEDVISYRRTLEGVHRGWKPTGKPRQGK